MNKSRSKITILLTIIVTSGLLLLIGLSAYASTVPGQPTGFSAIAISPTSVRLSWSPPQGGGTGIDHYVIESKTPTTAYSTAATPGNVTSYDITGLNTNQIYIFRVYATNATGNSIPSTEQPATPKSNSAPPKNIVPGPPIGLTATSYSGSQINLAWSPPASNGGYPVSGYMIQYQLDSGSFVTLTSNTGTSATGYSHTGLTAGHTYNYKVFAINSVGTGNSSNTASAIPTQVSTVPNPPTGLAASSASLTSISLSWTVPQNQGGSIVTGYKIEYKVGTGTYSVLISNTASTATSYLHTGLTTGTTYTYRVSAINSVGTGSPSNEVSATPTKTYTPTAVTAVAVSSTQINLSWVPPSETYNQIISGYRIDQRLSSGIFNTIVDNTGQSTSYSITNLSTGKTYTFVVIALYSGGIESNPSPEASATPTANTVPPLSTPPPTSNPPPQSTLPSVPIALNVTKVSSSSAQLAWTPPQNNGKPSIFGYKIEIKIGTGNWSTLIANAGNITSYTHTGLAGSTFTYRVSAINSVGIGNPSNEATVVFTNINPTPPPPPVESSGGTLAVVNTEYSVNYAIIGGKLLGISADKDTFSLQITLESKNNGVLSLNLPRDLIDAKKDDGSDDFFIVTAGKDLLKFNETKNSVARALTIGYPAGTNEIFIYGTHVVPEFPISMIVLLIALIPVIFFTKKIR